jgi:hypothetical protein
MSDPTYPPADRSVKIPHLVFGLLFLGGAGIWALGASNVISGERLAVLGPGVLIAAGIIGLAASLANGRNRRRSTSAYEPMADSTSYRTDTAEDSGTPDDTGSPNTGSPNTGTPTSTDYTVTDDDEHTKEIR